MKISKNFIVNAFAMLLVFALFAGCKKKEKELITKTITGSVQKGPFLNGTSILISELTTDLAQTGKTFTAQINNNLGNFQFSPISLVSPYVALRVDGFYFNEVCNSNSKSQITLTGLADVNNTTTTNVNVLTHLEKLRVEYLLSTGLTFPIAKTIAQANVLSIFNIQLQGIQNSELLNISSAGSQNAALLAASLILQGYRSESELTTLLSTISTDISIDGVLNNTEVQSSLIDHALLLDTVAIRNNLTNYFASQGINSTVPHFETYLQNFRTTTNYTITNSLFEYPATGQYGDNLLDKSRIAYTGKYFSGKVILKAGACGSFKVRITKIGGWIIFYSDKPNWYGSYDMNTVASTFTIVDPAIKENDIYLTLASPEENPWSCMLIEYFENSSSTPTFSKIVYVN
jgi:hypothetical protein